MRTHRIGLRGKRWDAWRRGLGVKGVFKWVVEMREMTCAVQTKKTSGVVL